MVSFIYKLLRIRNDVNAVLKGKVGARIGRRAIGRTMGKFMNGLFK